MGALQNMQEVRFLCVSRERGRIEDSGEAEKASAAASLAGSYDAVV